MISNKKLNKNKKMKGSKMGNNNRDKIKRINDVGFKEGMQSAINVFRENNYINELETLQSCLTNKHLTGKAVSILVQFFDELASNPFVFGEHIYLKNISKGMNQTEASKSMKRELDSYIDLGQIINKYFIVNITNETIYVAFASDYEVA